MRKRDIVSSSSGCLATLPQGLRVYTLFCMRHGKGITVTLSLALAIDSTISFAHDFVLEQDIREVCRLDLSEMEKQIQMGLR